MQTLTDLDPPKRVHRLTLCFAVSGWFIENESRFFNSFLNNFLSSKILAYGQHITRIEITKVLSSYYCARVL